MQRQGFATAINCIDGRAQIPVIEWMRDHFNIEYVDMITEPGPDRALALGPPGTIAAIKQKVLLSVQRHLSHIVAIAAHHDCLANPIGKREHADYVKQSVGRIASWGAPVRVVGLWVDERWHVEVVADTNWIKPLPRSD